MSLPRSVIASRSAKAVVQLRQCRARAEAWEMSLPRSKVDGLFLDAGSVTNNSHSSQFKQHAICMDRVMLVPVPAWLRARAAEQISRCFAVSTRPQNKVDWYL